MNSRQGIKKNFNHEQSNKLVVNFGPTLVTGMQASVVYKLRQWYELDDPLTPVTVINHLKIIA